MPSSSTTTQNAPAVPPNVYTLPRTQQLEALYTIIRDKDTPRGDFIFYSDRIIRLLVEEGLNHLPVIPKSVQTPTVRVDSVVATSASRSPLALRASDGGERTVQEG
jgi:uracil phosphoribosyltransferase